MEAASSPRSAHVPSAMHNQDRHAGYFELTEELLLQNKDYSGKNSGKQGECALLCVITFLQTFFGGFTLTRTHTQSELTLYPL